MADATTPQANTNTQILDITKAWTDNATLATMRQMYAPTLNDQEFKVFATLGKMTGLNPALREIWAVKYGNAPACIFIGRDGYRKSAQAHKDYEYHSAVAVYSNDKVKINPALGNVEHDFSLTERGTLIGAYCVVKRKGSAYPAFNYVDVKEYKQPHGVWKDKPATMICKVAEAQGLRGSFQELFGGTYDESEQWEKEEKKRTERRSSAIEVTPPVEVAPEAETMPAEIPPPEVNQRVYDAKQRCDSVTSKEGLEEVRQYLNHQSWDGTEINEIMVSFLAAKERMKNQEAETVNITEEAARVFPSTPVNAPEPPRSVEIPAEPKNSQEDVTPPTPPIQKPHKRSRLAEIFDASK